MDRFGGAGIEDLGYKVSCTICFGNFFVTSKSRRSHWGRAMCGMGQNIKNMALQFLRELSVSNHPILRKPNFDGYRCASCAGITGTVSGFACANSAGLNPVIGLWWRSLLSHANSAQGIAARVAHTFLSFAFLLGGVPSPKQALTSSK